VGVIAEKRRPELREKRAKASAGTQKKRGGGGGGVGCNSKKPHTNSLGGGLGGKRKMDKNMKRALTGVRAPKMR